MAISINQKQLCGVQAVRFPYSHLTNCSLDGRQRMSALHSMIDDQSMSNLATLYKRSLSKRLGKISRVAVGALREERSL